MTTINKKKKQKKVPFFWSIIKTYPLTVNYEMSAEEVLKIGRFGISDSCKIINFSTFPRLKGTENIEVNLVCFEGILSNNKAICNLNEIGMRPINLLELLAFGMKYPDDIERRYPIVALGSQYTHWSGIHFVPILKLNKLGQNFLDMLNDIKNSFEDLLLSRFAAIRK